MIHTNDMRATPDATSVVDHQDNATRITPESNQTKKNGMKFPKLSEPVTQQLVSLFKLLSDPTRLKILLILGQQSELHVRALCDLLEQSQPAVSHHLALLRVAGLIDCRRAGKHNFYRLTSLYLGNLLNNVFADVPKKDRQMRIENYLLSYRPIS